MTKIENQGSENEIFKNIKEFDQDTINELYKSFEKEWIILMFDDFLKNINALDSAIKTKNYNKLETLSHKVKGNSLLIWAIKLSKICKSIQNVSNDMTWINEFVIQYEAEIELVKNDINTILFKLESC